MDSLQVLFWATLGSVISLVGGMVLLRATRLRQQVIVYALPFGAGTLLATAVVSTHPEALEDREASEILMWALSGFLLFFALERLVGWFHHHHHDDVHAGHGGTCRIGAMGGGRNQHHVAMGVATADVIFPDCHQSGIFSCSS